MITKCALLQLASITVLQGNAFEFHPSRNHSLLRANNDATSSTNSQLYRKLRFRTFAPFQSTSKEDISEYEHLYDIPSLKDGLECGGRDMITHVKYLDKSLAKLTGRGIYERMNIPRCDSTDEEIYQSICNNERYVLISHGTQDSPVFNYGNMACVNAFARSWENLTSMPSRECVISKSQDEAVRIELMRNVTDYGFVDGEFRGYRVRGDGKFIKLTECVVWNCYSEDGETYIGQAALFDRNASPIVDTTDEETDSDV